MITLQDMATTLEDMDLTLSPQDGRLETGFAQGLFHIIIIFSVLIIVSLFYPTLSSHFQLLQFNKEPALIVSTNTNYMSSTCPTSPSKNQVNPTVDDWCNCLYVFEDSWYNFLIAPIIYHEIV